MTALRRMLGAVLIAGVLATAAPAVHAADSTTYEQTWLDSFNAWGFSYVQWFIGMFGYCYPNLQRTACL